MQTLIRNYALPASVPRDDIPQPSLGGGNGLLRKNSAVDARDVESLAMDTTHSRPLLSSMEDVMCIPEKVLRNIQPDEWKSMIEMLDSKEKQDAMGHYRRVRNRQSAEHSKQKTRKGVNTLIDASTRLMDFNSAHFSSMVNMAMIVEAQLGRDHAVTVELRRLLESYDKEFTPLKNKTEDAITKCTGLVAPKSRGMRKVGDVVSSSNQTTMEQFVASPTVPVVDVDPFNFSSPLW